MPSPTQVATHARQVLARLNAIDFWRALRDALRFPGLASVLWSRPIAAVALLGVVLGAFVFPPHGYESFQSCQFYASTHLPCAGCGLTRSVSCFFQGHWRLAVAYHPLGPMIAVTMALMALGAVLPTRAHAWWVARMERIEAWFGWFVAVLIVTLLVYGIVRLSLVTAGYESLQWWRTTGRPPM